MKLLIALLALIVLSGCVKMSVETHTDGTCTAEYKAFLKHPDVATFEGCGASGSYEGSSFFSWPFGGNDSKMDEGE